MIHVFRIVADGSDLHGESFEIQDASRERADERAAARVAETFSLASREMRQRARAEFVASFASRRALEKAEESGVSLAAKPVARRIVDEPYDRDGTPGKACLGCSSAWPANELETTLSHASGCAAAPMPAGDVDAVLDCLLGDEFRAVAS